MSDFWKKRRPQLTDDEERALWERVRTMPAEARGAARARSPWAALWARPAVRFGAPVLAVALVAIVWVAQQSPEAPRPESVLGTVGTVGTSDTEQRAKLQVATPENESDAPESAPAPVPVVGRDARMRTPAAASVREEEAMEPAAPQRESANRADDEGAAQSQAKEKATFAAPPAASSTSPPPPPAPTERKAEGKAEGARVLAKSSAPSSPEAVRGEAATGAAALQAYRAMPEADAGVTTRVAAVTAAWGNPAVARTLTPRILQDVLRRETEGPFFGTYRMPFTGEVIKFGGMPESPGVLTATTPRERRAVLAMELSYAIALGERGDRGRVGQVTDAATRLAAEHPDDAGAQALVEWCIATTRAMKSK